jgi:hypothetical protein
LTVGRRTGIVVAFQKRCPVRRAAFASLAVLLLAGCTPPEIETGLVPYARIVAPRDDDDATLWGATFAADWRIESPALGDWEGPTADISYFYFPGGPLLTFSAGLRIGWALANRPRALRISEPSRWRFIMKFAWGCWMWAGSPEAAGGQFAFTGGLDYRLSEYSLIGVDGVAMQMWNTHGAGHSLLSRVVARYSIEF